MADLTRPSFGSDADMNERQRNSFAVHAGPGDRLRELLRGRRRECETLDRLIKNLRAGRTQMLVVRGERGVGKSALLDYLAERATGCRVVRAAGIESERGLAFAGLHQLCAPILDGIVQLPEPQSDALGTVFGLRARDAPERLVVGLAVMGLLAEAATDRPLVCILSDAQWLDEASAQTLGFVARRLTGKPVAIVISMCSSSDSLDFTGVPEMVVAGLAEGDARALLRFSVPGPLDEVVQERIVREARGNPLALKQATTGQRPDDLAGGYGPPCNRMPVWMQRAFRRRLAPMPSATRRLLLLAAAEPTGDAVLLWAAANQLGISAGAAAPAVATRLVELDGHVKFCHPLMRAAVYQAASLEERKCVHGALADVTDRNTDPDRRAWHRACAALDMDDDAANELERNAELARSRGGLSAVSAFVARAAELTLDPGCRARRALTAAEMNQQAGSWEAARRLLAMAQAGPLDEAHDARLQLLRARLSARSDRGMNTSLLLLEAAERLAPEQPELARQAHGEAMSAALTAGRLGSRDACDVAQAVRAALGPRSPGGPGLLLEGACVLASEGHVEGAPLIKRALEILRDQEARAEDRLCWLPLGCRMAQEVWDDGTWQVMSTWLIEFARRVGALTLLPEALTSGAIVQLLTAGYDVATPMAEEADTVSLATGNYVGPYGRLLCAAWRGSVSDTYRLIDEATTTLVERGEGAWLTAAYVATAVAHNGWGRYDEALVAAEHANESPDELGLASWSLVELIEAAVRVGAPERAAEAARRLSVRTDASATDWALGIADRSMALLTRGKSAERLYRASIEKLGRTLMRAELGRAHLLYGEWLRRQGRRVNAREQLRTAHEMMISLGFEGFAERARRELVATGGSPHKRTIARDDLLTAQEAQIARMAREGRTNSEIGIELYISPRTVEWHLRKVFMKLGVSSRRGLSEAMEGPPAHRLPRAATTREVGVPQSAASIPKWSDRHELPVQTPGLGCVRQSQARGPGRRRTK